MNTNVYYIDCLTNLHVGSGDANFNIVDKEVEKDPLTGYPIIHASGIKGALREKYGAGKSKEEVTKCFGKAATDNESDTGGSYKFFDARFLYRPLRASGDLPYVNVTTITAIKEFAELTKAFDINIGLDVSVLNKVVFSNDIKFMVTDKGISVEGEKCDVLNSDVIKALEPFLGDHFAIAKTLDGYDLPVIARNCLIEKKRNLWYEEYVPHGSRFYMLVILPPKTDQKEVEEVIPRVAQIGGNNSVGYGYCRFECKFRKEEA